MRHQQVSVNVWQMVISSCSYLALAFCAWVLLRLINACFWLPGALAKQQERQKEMLKNLQESISKDKDGDDFWESLMKEDDGTEEKKPLISEEEIRELIKELKLPPLKKKNVEQEDQEEKVPLLICDEDSTEGEKPPAIIIDEVIDECEDEEKDEGKDKDVDKEKDKAKEKDKGEDKDVDKKKDEDEDKDVEKKKDEDKEKTAELKEAVINNNVGEELKRESSYEDLTDDSEIEEDIGMMNTSENEAINARGKEVQGEDSTGQAEEVITSDDDDTAEDLDGFVDGKGNKLLNEDMHEQEENELPYEELNDEDDAYNGGNYSDEEDKEEEELTEEESEGENMENLKRIKDGKKIKLSDYDVSNSMVQGIKKKKY